MTSDPLYDAWEAVHAANDGLGWQIGKPRYDERRNEWSVYLFDPRERPKVGHRSREWTAVAPTLERLILTAARCLREIGEGRCRNERVARHSVARWRV